MGGAELWVCLRLVMDVKNNQVMDVKIHSREPFIAMASTLLGHPAY